MDKWTICLRRRDNRRQSNRGTYLVDKWTSCLRRQGNRRQSNRGTYLMDKWTSKRVDCNRRQSNRGSRPSVTQKNFVHLLLCLHNYLVFISSSCSSVTMSFIYPVYSQVASCLNKGIYIYIIRRQKSVKFNYFSNLPICRRYANSLNRRKLLICRTTSQSIDLHMITKEQNQAI